ncbi:redoxin domain-containing protein [Paenibacillus sp. FA6]|uniref:redoxin domain-containing protein n=1 Tax=Paenibacillus sp. FA6 TaxID=3413029 RepID=UPI003F65751D
MGKSRKKVQVVILLLIFILGGYAIISNVYGSGGKPEVGNSTPSFNLLGLDGKVHNLDEYKGNAMVINFWGTWCKPCVKEMPALQSQSEKWKDKNVVVIGINAGEDLMSVENFVKQANISFPILLDPNREAVRSYGISPLPTTLFVSSDGIIRNIHSGELDLGTLDYEIEQLVNTR